MGGYEGEKEGVGKNEGVKKEEGRRVGVGRNEEVKERRRRGWVEMKE